jgi:hypothetical protein
MSGSYVALRERERAEKKAKRAAATVFKFSADPEDAAGSAATAPSSQPAGEELPDFLK